MTEEQKRRAEIDAGFDAALEATDIDRDEFLSALADWLDRELCFDRSGLEWLLLVALRELAGVEE